MRLTKAAILAIKGAEKRVKQDIAEALDVHPSSVYRFLEANDDNLTKAAVLEIIKKETGLPLEMILEVDKVEEAQS